MRTIWKWLVCVFAHHHIMLTEPVAHVGAYTVYRRHEVCLDCEAGRTER